MTQHHIPATAPATADPARLGSVEFTEPDEILTEIDRATDLAEQAAGCLVEVSEWAAGLTDRVVAAPFRTGGIWLHTSGAEDAATGLPDLDALVEALETLRGAVEGEMDEIEDAGDDYPDRIVPAHQRKPVVHRRR